MRDLAGGESVVVDVRPHWWFLAGPVAALAAAIAVSIAAIVVGVPGWAKWILLAVLVVAVAWMIGRYARWNTTRLIVTTTRIIDRRGVLRRSGREIPLSALSDIGYRQTIFDRLIGAGDVVIESAARDGQEVFPDLRHPARIQNEIYAQMQRSRPVPVPAPASIPDQIEQLDRLRQRGVITGEEFAAKKADLLNRL